VSKQVKEIPIKLALRQRPDVLILGEVRDPEILKTLLAQIDQATRVLHISTEKIEISVKE